MQCAGIGFSSASGDDRLSGIFKILKDKFLQSFAMMKNLNVASFTIRGCKTEYSSKIKKIVIDSEKYNIQILGLTETDIEDKQIEEIKGKKKTMMLYIYVIGTSTVE